MDTQDWVAIIGSFGGGAVLIALVNGIGKWISGSTERESERNASVLAQRRVAIEERNEAVREREMAIDDRDAADARRRIANEYASTLRRILSEHGIIPPPWPDILSNKDPFKEKND